MATFQQVCWANGGCDCCCESAVYHSWGRPGGLPKPPVANACKNLKNFTM